MFSIAFLVGIYAKGLFVLGLLQLYSLWSITLYTIIFIGLSVYGWKFFDETISLRNFVHEVKSLWKRSMILSLLMAGSIAVVSMGILIPEVAFDSLWYHLTLPKLYLEMGGIQFIPGSLYYYSALPKIGELLYLLPVGIQTEQLAKLIHALFGVGTCIILYQIAKIQTNKYLAMVSVVIFLGNIVVLWQATTSYIDLIRTFFEAMALYGLIAYESTRKKKWLVESAISLGLAIESKLLSLGTLVTYTVFIFLSSKSKRVGMSDILRYVVLAILIPLPWFVFSFIHTGNPIYPIFTEFNPPFNFDPLSLVKDSFLIFVSSFDPVSPVYIAFLPLLPSVWGKLTSLQKKFFIMALVSFLVWLLTPRTGGGRFIMAQLPLFSLCVVLVIYYSRPYIQKVLVLFVVFIAIIALSYRTSAQIRDWRVVLGIESKHEYLAKNLNYDFGDFYDTDNYFRNSIDPEEKVLLIGFHNIYYADFRFIHQSYQKNSDIFRYIATQDSSLPNQYKSWVKIYTNNTTHVTLYRDPQKREYRNL